MVFGILIDIPLLVGTFLLMLRFRKRLVQYFLKINLPPFALYLILCIPLIIFEEDIDCMPAWCGTVVIPPTLPFLFVEILALGWLVLHMHATHLFRITLLFSTYGVFFELILGGLRGAPAIIVVLLGPYVALGYAFVSMLPLAVLLEGKQAKPASQKPA